MSHHPRIAPTRSSEADIRSPRVVRVAPPAPARRWIHPARERELPSAVRSALDSQVPATFLIQARRRASADSAITTSLLVVVGEESFRVLLRIHVYLAVKVLVSDQTCWAMPPLPLAHCPSISRWQLAMAQWKWKAGRDDSVGRTNLPCDGQRTRGILSVAFVCQFLSCDIIAWRASGSNYAGIRGETMCVGHGLEPGSEQRAEALGRGRARGRGGRLGSAAPSRKWLLCLLRRFERSGSESAKRT